MYRVLIVDDEPVITEGLCMLVDWDSYGFKEVLTATDGDDALDKAKSKKFDLIITDIRMPGLSGLQLIKTIKSKYPATKLVIISGYNDFSYAKEAIKYGVRDYLLKPIDKEELTQALSKITKELDKDLHDQYLISNKDNLVRDKLLLDVVNGKHSSFDVLDDSGLFCFDYSNLCFSVALIEIDKFQELMEENKEDARLIKFGVRNILENLFEHNNLGYVYEDTDDLLGIILYFDNPENVKSRSFQLFSEAYSYVSNFYKNRINIAMSSANNFANIKTSRQQALFARERRFIVSSDTFIIPYDNVVVDESMELSIQWDSNLILNAIETLEYVQIKDQIGLLIEEVVDKKLSRDIINGIIFNMTFALQQLIKKHDKDPLECLDIKSVLNYMNSYKNIRSLESWLNEICINVGNHIVELGPYKSNNLIEKIIQYVNENFRQDLSLKSIANEFYLNSAYLGRLFKNETGENFNDYLNKKRISEAKKYYVSSNIRINKILYEVGYKNPEYFYRIFKKYEGTTFSEYSENIKNLRRGNQE